MTRKIIDVPWNVSTSLYEFWVRKCSFGVASCARMSSAMIPPPAKKTSAVTMYMTPIRLWSTVTSHRATRPLRQLTATAARSLVDVRLRVRDERVDLVVRPRVADRRHQAASFAHDRCERRLLREDRVRAQGGTVPAFALHAVAGRARALELRAAELGARRRGCELRLVLGGVEGDDARLHLRVERAADEAAVPLVRPGPVDLEARVVDAAGNRLELAAELRDPEAVDHVAGHDGQAHLRSDRDVERVDRLRPVRIVELPVELMPLDRDLAVRRRRGRRRDLRQLDEDDRADRRDDQHRDHR